MEPKSQKQSNKCGQRQGVDAGSYREDLDCPGRLFHEILPVRDMLATGDLRPLYLAWLACNRDEEALEPPVPAGLGRQIGPLNAMAEFYEIPRGLIAAAAERSPALPETRPYEMLKAWLARQPQKDLCELVQELLTGDRGAARSETMRRVWAETRPLAWPVAQPTRTMAQLRALPANLPGRRVSRKQQAADIERRKRLERIATYPSELIAEVEKLAGWRSEETYRRAAEGLIDLREALGPGEGPAQARAVAERIHDQFPKDEQLTSVLRTNGFLE